MAKKGGNPQNFVKCSEEMAEKPLSVRVPVAIDQYVRSLPNRTEWLREAILEKKQREEGFHQS